MTTRAGYKALLARRYGAWGLDVSLFNPTNGQPLTLRMIDMTRGVEVGDGAAEVSTVLPVAAVRQADLTAANLDAQAMIGEELTLNGVNWLINSHAPKPGPHGPEDGEVYFMLVDADG